MLRAARAILSGMRHDIRRFNDPGKLVSCFGLNPRFANGVSARLIMGTSARSGAAAPRHARRGGLGRGYGAGPLHAFFVRIRARRGHQIAAVAGARKLAVLCWHVLTKEQDYLWARPALVANKMRALQLQADFRRRKAISADPPTPITSRRCATRN